MDWEFGVSRCKPSQVEWITHKDLPKGTGNSTQHSVTTEMGTESEKEWTHAYA